MDFVVGEVLTNPTERSIEIALLPGEDVELYAAYQELAEGPPRRSPQIQAAARELAVLKLGRSPARSRVRVRGLAPASRGWRVRRAAGCDVSNSASPGRLGLSLRLHRGLPYRGTLDQGRLLLRGPSRSGPLENFGATLENILRANVDFTIAGGDNSMVHAPRA